MKFISLLAIALIASLNACAVNLGQDSRYGNYGGPPREKQPEPPFSIESTYRDVRWFPTHVRYAPDGSHLLVSLCHTMRPSLCRIGKYFIAEKEWEILPYEDRRTYRWPVYHPGGKEIAVSTGPCDEQYRCALNDYALVRMAADGSQVERVGDVIASDMSFSPDGKKLIYWRLGGISVQGRGMALADLYEIDWASGTERPLTQLKLWQEELRAPFFVEDGRAFIFNASTYGSHKVHNGNNHARIGKAPVTARADLSNIDIGGLPLAVTPQDKVLYSTDLRFLREAGSPVALALRPGKVKRGPGAITPADVIGTEAQNRWFGEGPAVFLKSLAPGSQEEAGFDIALHPFSAAISPDTQHVAYLKGGSPISSPGVKLGLIGRGNVPATQIDWPKLELKPGRRPATKP